MGRKIINLKDIKLSEESKKELAEIEKVVRGDMTDEEWAFFKTIRCVTPIKEYLRLEKEAGNNNIEERFCGKCKTNQCMFKRIIAKGTSKECHTWWCPNCKDQISEGATHLA